MGNKFNIKSLGLTISIGLAVLFITNSCSSFHKRGMPPNIIVFIVDDMGLMDTSVPFLTDEDSNPVKQPLNEFYLTPNMEKLAKQGVRFTNFYAHSVCSPTRVSLLTGQNSARHGATNWIKSENNNRTEFGPANWNWKGLSKESVTLPGILQQKGYQTIHVGKAHFGPKNSDGEDPLNLGFDINIAGNSFGHPGSYYGMDGFGHIRGQKKRAVPGLEKYHSKEVFLTEALTREANAAISHANDEGKPFFLYMSHYAVHAPFQSDPRFAEHYKSSGKPEKAQAYATLIEGIDKSLGDIMQHVKDLGLDKNTLLLFLGDNGSDAPLPIDDGYSSSAPLKGNKGKHWEGGMRVPFIAAWITPDEHSFWQKKLPIARNAIHLQMGSVLDIFSTVCNLTDAISPKDHVIDGIDLQLQLTNKNNPERDECFLNHFPHQHRSSYFSSLVDKNWKVIYHYQVDGQPDYELYNLGKDPFEKQNLADKNPEKLTFMLTRLKEELDSKNALYPEKEGGILEIIMPEKQTKEL